MRDWSGALVSSEIHRRKAEKELVLINAGLSREMRDVLIGKSEEQLLCMLYDVMDALRWVRDQK